MVIAYRSDQGEQYYSDLIYYCNACGELHNGGKESIQPEDLPTLLQSAYDEIWTDQYSGLCYLVEYCGQYYVALVYEFDEWTANSFECSIDDLWYPMVQQAIWLSQWGALEEVLVLVAERLGFNSCHEMVFLMPADMKREEFDAVAHDLDRMVYDLPKI